VALKITKHITEFLNISDWCALLARLCAPSCVLPFDFHSNLFLKVSTLKLTGQDNK